MIPVFQASQVSPAVEAAMGALWADQAHEEGHRPRMPNTGVQPGRPPSATAEAARRAITEYLARYPEAYFTDIRIDCALDSRACRDAIDSLIAKGQVEFYMVTGKRQPRARYSLVSDA